MFGYQQQQNTQQNITQKEQQLMNSLMNDPLLKNDPLLSGLANTGMPDETLQFTSPVLSSAYDKNFLIYSLDPSKIVKDVEHDLRNEYWKEEEKKWVTRGDPYINGYGVNRLIGFLKPFLDKNFALSDLDAEDIEKTIKAFAHALNNTLYNEWERMGLTEPNSDNECNLSAYNSVYEIIVSHAYANLLRGKDGFTMKIIRTVFKAEERDQQQNKKGMGMSIPNPFSKKY